MKINLYLYTQGLSLGLKDGEIYVKSVEGEILKTYPSCLIGIIYVYGNIYLTTQLIRHLLKNEIPVVFLSTKGDYIGSLLSITNKKHLLKYRQWEVFKDEQTKIFLTKEILFKKFEKQKEFLYQQYKNSNKIDDFSYLKKELENTFLELKRCHQFEKLNGIEGYFSRLYFSNLGKFIKNPDFCFYERSKYPPRDEFNSLLSFGYTLLVNFITGLIFGQNLDPYIGFYHKNDYNRPNLALDIMEPFRVYIDRICFSLVNLKILKKENFKKENDLILIDDNGIKEISKKFQKDFLNNKHIVDNLEKTLSFVIKTINEKATVLSL
jgi:CRISPR-associated protein Cas1